MVKVVLPGRPITKKNHMKMVKNKKTGKMFPIQSDQYREYEEACLWILRMVPDKFYGPIWVKVLYWMPNRRGEPDLLGLLQSTADILEKARVIDNDKNIKSFDGSRIVGIDAARPRAEVEIQEWSGGSCQICCL